MSLSPDRSAVCLAQARRDVRRWPMLWSARSGRISESGPRFLPGLPCRGRLVPEYLHELEREEATLRAVRAEVGHRFHEAVWMLSLTIQQLRTELRWLRKMAREVPRRGAARHAQYAGNSE